MAPTRGQLWTCSGEWPVVPGQGSDGTGLYGAEESRAQGVHDPEHVVVWADHLRLLALSHTLQTGLAACREVKPS